SAYTFIYSKRSHTPAAKLESVSNEQEIKERFDRILEAVKETGELRTKRHTGMTLPVLFEEPDAKDPSMITGRLSCNTVVHVKGDESLIGTIADVKLDECRGFYYMGSLAGDA
ncbi:MAG: TRAM domain-containing protein, partial [Lachnospiraceae bacterium]|nr:TRAM domain-containing protein [Lachnospiraceae bacterium]